MTGPPGYRAMQQHLTLRLAHRVGERLHRRGRIRKILGAAHRKVDVLHPQLFDELGLIERNARHLRRAAEVDDGGDSLRTELAEGALGGLAADEDVVANARELVLEEAGSILLNGSRYLAHRVRAC